MKGSGLDYVVDPELTLTGIGVISDLNQGR